MELLAPTPSKRRLGRNASECIHANVIAITKDTDKVVRSFLSTLRNLGLGK